MPVPIAIVETLESRTLLSITVTNSFGLDGQSNTIDVPAKAGDSFVHDFFVTITNDAGVSTPTINATQLNPDGTVSAVITGTVKGPAGFGSLNTNHSAVLDFYLNGSTTTSVANITNFTDEGVGADQRDTIAYSTTIKLPGGENNTSLGLIFSNLTTNQKTPLIPMTTIQVDTIKPTIASVGGVNAVNVAPVASVPVSLADPITASTFNVNSISLTRDGASVPLTSSVTVTPVNGSSVNFNIAGLAAFTQQPGNYVLTVNAAAIKDPALNSGSGTKSVSFAVVNVPPVAQIVVAPTKFPKKGPANFTGAGTDANPGDALQFSWVATTQIKAKKRGKPPTTKVVATGAGLTFGLNTKAKGVYTVTLTVTDSHGATSTVARKITHK